MAATIQEKPDGRTHGDESSSIDYLIHTTDQSEASALAAISALEAADGPPDTLNGQVRGPLTVTATENLDLWTSTVPYKPAEKQKKEIPAAGDRGWSLSTMGEKKHITNSRSTTKFPTAAPDYKQLIGVTTGGPAGVDIIIPSFNFSQKFYVASANFTATYIGYLREATGKTNSAIFSADFQGHAVNFAIGEALCNGVQCNPRASDVEVDVSFSALPNETGLTIGAITGIAKGAWEYLWIQYEETEDATAKRLVKQPVAVYVEQVYDAFDFAKIVPGWTAPPV